MPRRPRSVALLVGSVALALAAATASAQSRPELVFDAGRTLAATGEPGSGGFSLGLSLLWKVEDRFRIGVMAFADGLGERTDRLVGPGGVDLGPVAGVHRAAQGAVMRAEAHAPGARRVVPFIAATWGYYRVEDDRRGVLVAVDEAAGFGLGAGLLRPFNERHAAGVTVRAQQLSRSGAGRYLGAALEWRWRVGAGD